VVHCLPHFVPEELLDAAGVLPVGVWGAERPVTRAEAVMQAFACSMARTTLELGMEGKLGLVDGMVFPSCCDTIRNLAELWKHQVPGKLVHSVIYPAHPGREAARPFLLAELERFRDVLRAWTGRSVTDADLAASLAKYEAGRAALRDLAAVRRAYPEKLRAREMATVVQAASMMDRAEFTELARALAAALPARAAVAPGRHRIVLAGTLPLPLSVVDAIEAAGGLIAQDDLGLGAKYYERTLPAGDGDPLARLADSLLVTTPACTIHAGTATRGAYLLALAKAAGARGIVFAATKFCEPEYFDHPDVKKELDAAGTPSLVVETEMSAGAPGALATRIGAFLESLD
jgi:bcr-type benzoyl-CoA reductase subunit C